MLKTRCVLALLPLAALAQPASAPPTFRLGDAVRPVHYRLDLTIVPQEENFSGAVEIDLELREPSAVIWLNAADLTVDSASVDGRAARVLTGNGDFLGFAFEEPLAAGRARLRVAYRGQLNSKSSGGLFRNKDGDEWYAYSQFESTDARRAFPCFDEPSFKVPWQLTLHVRKEHLAFSNTPALSDTAEGGGMKAVKFAETKPLPSYLVALAAGPFETVDAGKAGRKKTPLRIIATRGKAAQARYAAQVTGEILTALENYFDIPYPYEKLDSIAVPLFFGAMENPGLVTYSLTTLLSAPEEDSISRQRGYANVAAHELAHMWFGDLVTTAWWDDIWLNEAFATWMAAKTIEAWKPEWKAELSAVQSRLGSMGADSLISARKVRQPVLSKNDIANAFDGITYGKGAAVIYMFESWIGPDAFRRGVKKYMERHAYGNATATDFLKAIGEAAGRDIAPAFSTFLDQAGVPLVSGELKCGAGRPVLALAQKRFLPLGSKGSSQQTWQIPVCVRYGDGTDTRSQCTLLAQPQAELTLDSNGCPAWVLLNKGEDGYYRSLYRGDLLDKLLADHGRQLGIAEVIGVIGDVQAAVRSGDLPAGNALKLVPEFAGDPNRQIVGSTVGIVAGINEHLVPDDLRPNYLRFVRKYYGARARELGWQPKPGEDDDVRLLRPTLLALAANIGEDPQLVEEAQRLARKWLEDRRAIAPDLTQIVLVTAARHGDRSLYERFYAEAKKTKDEKERGQLLGAMASFRDPAIVENNFRLLLSGEFDFRQAVGLLLGPLRDPQTRELPFQFIRQRYDEVVSKLPRAVGTDYSAFLPMVTTAFCDDRHREEAESFFKERSAKAIGGPRMLAQALESIGLCTANRVAQEPAVAEFLRKY